METRVESILSHFSYEHLPPALAEVSRGFCDLAHDLVDVFELAGPQVEHALQQLLVAKDAAVRAQLEKQRASTDQV